MVVAVAAAVVGVVRVLVLRALYVFNGPTF